jgi:CheY-like chemotaxis protein
MKQIKSILLIDDSAATNNFHQRLLQKLSFSKEIIICNNGQEGLNYIHTTTSPPSLIFLDLNMPILDGFEFLEKFSNSFPNQETLIVVLSSSDENIDKERCKSSYTNIKFCSKPLTIDQLKKINTLV